MPSEQLSVRGPCLAGVAAGRCEVPCGRLAAGVRAVSDRDFPMGQARDAVVLTALDGPTAAVRSGSTTTEEMGTLTA
jgi:hypothetical protein